jgi:hypothetical protein
MSRSLIDFARKASGAKQTAETKASFTATSEVKLPAGRAVEKSSIE